LQKQLHLPLTTWLLQVVAAVALVSLVAVALVVTVNLLRNPYH